MKLKALIVDDEHSGRAALKILLVKNHYYLFADITTVNSLEDAISMISNSQFHICFLDVQLNNKSGFDLLSHLSPLTTVIFVTAYSEYAINALREKAFDYLLKPINPLELKKCMNRYEQDFLLEEDSKRYLTIKINGATTPLRKDEIQYIQADGAYAKIVMDDKREYTTAKTLKVILCLLDLDFVRIHKSYAVNRAMIKSFRKELLTTKQNACLPVSRVGAKELSRHF